MHLVLQDDDAAPLQRAAHTKSVIPPIVIAQYGYDSAGSTQAAKDLGRDLRLDESAPDHAVDHVVAEKHDDIGRGAVHLRDDGSEPVDADMGSAGMHVAHHRDAQAIECGWPSREREIDRPYSHSSRLDEDRPTQKRQRYYG